MIQLRGHLTKRRGKAMIFYISILVSIRRIIQIEHSVLSRGNNKEIDSKTS